MTTAIAHQVADEVEARARQSQGTSDTPIYQMVVRALQQRDQGGGVLVDVGCGTGQLWRHVGEHYTRYVGVDAACYEDLPAEVEFHRVDLNADDIPLPDECADVVVSVETIEHLENPRAFMREMVRLAKPGGWIVVTTPNQLSLLSLLTLTLKQRFSAFQDVHYPAHLTALLEIDLRRIAGECGLRNVQIKYSLQGRLVLTPWHYPGAMARLFPRALSDNLLLIGMKRDD
jgi:2-polyprenyl-3-methyl-5-hydroxy-6-metoxy-1,4-benzoquinol methylase